MNEWSSSVTFSSYQEQSRRFPYFRSQWEELGWDRITETIDHFREMSDCRIRDIITPEYHQQSLLEDSFICAATCPTRRKKFNTSDPRFKRKLSKETDQSYEGNIKPIIEEDSNGYRPNHLKTARQREYYPSETSFDEFIEPEKMSNCRDLEKKVTTTTLKPIKEDKCFDDECLTGVSIKEISSYDLNPVGKAEDELKLTVKDNFLKKSMSDCTIRTKNSITSEDSKDDHFWQITTSPSASRISRVNDWIENYNYRPTKRRSAVTLVGKKHEGSRSSKVNNFTPRKTEAENYALEPNLLLPSQETDSSKEKLVNEVYYDPCNIESITEFNFPKTEKSRISEPASSRNHARKRSRFSKRGIRKSVMEKEFGIKGKIHVTLSKLQYRFIICTIAVLTGALLFWFVCFLLRIHNPIDQLKRFYSKPKTVSWYEKWLL